MLRAYMKDPNLMTTRTRQGQDKDKTRPSYSYLSISKKIINFVSYFNRYFSLKYWGD